MGKYHKRIQVEGSDAFELAVNITGKGAPTEDTEAEPGMVYMDEESANGDLYKCISRTQTKEKVVYTWKKMPSQEAVDSLSKAIVNLENKISSGGGASSVDISYKWARRGYMRDHVRDFQGWAHCIQYDSDLELAVGIVISGTGSHSNSQPWYRVTIDPKTGYMSDYQEITLNYGEATDTTETGYVGSFLILPDGTYWMCDYQRRIWHSADKGLSWNYAKEIENWSRTTKNNDSLFGATILSNGRIVAGNIGQPAAETYYSDDDGLSWNTVKMDVSALGSQVYPEGNYKPFEPFFVDCGDGKVIQYARASMNAYKTYADGGFSAKEPAVYSISNDNGTTWSAWQWSKSLTDMTANNGKAVVIGDKVYAVYGSRYHDGDEHFRLYFASTTTADILNDAWETPVVIDVGHWDIKTASYSSDCGYPSLFTSDGNLLAVYYDSDGTGSAFGANWRLCIGSQGVAQIAPVASGGGARNVGYTQADVDAFMAKMQAKINDLYLLIGQIPPVEDGEVYPVTEGLIEWFETGDETQWDGYTINSKIKSGKTGRFINGGKGQYVTETTLPETFKGNMVGGGVVFNSTLEDYGVTDAFTLEFVLDMNTSQTFYMLLQSPLDLYGGSTVLLSRNNNMGGSIQYCDKAFHWVAVVTTEETKYYFNGESPLLNATGVTLTAEQIASGVPIASGYGSKKSGIGSVRLYNRALTEEEIKNNYEYAKTLTDIGTDIWTNS